MMYLYIAFAVYGFFVSLVATAMAAGESFDPLLYAAQHFIYVALLGTMLPGLIAAAPDRVARVVVWLAGAFCVAVILSPLFGGSIYPWQVGGSGRWYRDESGEIVRTIRAHGPLDSINLTGGLCAVFVAMFLWLPLSRRAKTVLVPLASISLLLTMSRSAMIAGAFGWLAVLLLLGMRMRYPTPRTASVLASACVLLVLSVSAVAVSDDTRTFRADQRTFLADLEKRQEIWAESIESWSTTPPLKTLFGAGFRSAGRSEDGDLRSEHNGYLNALNDVGLFGVAMLLAVMLGTLLPAARRIISGIGRRYDPAVVGIVVAIMTHNGSQVFWHAPPIVFMLTFAIALAGTRVKAPAVQPAG